MEIYAEMSSIQIFSLFRVFNQGFIIYA